MAIAFSRYVDGTTSSGSTTAAVDLSACSAGDLAFVLISRSDTTVPTIAPGSWGLFEFYRSTYSMWLYAKILDAADLGTLTWTYGTTSSKTLVTAAVYTGAEVVSHVPGSYTTGSGSTVDCGSITSSQTWMVGFCSAYSTAAKTYDALAGYTERREYGHTDPDFYHLIADTNGGWGGGACAPDFTLSAASTFRGGLLVELQDRGTSVVTAANLTYEYVAKTAKTGTLPGNNADPTTTWVANVGSNSITLQNTGGSFAWNDSGSGWDGDGTAADPYCLRSDGTGDYGTFASNVVTSDADFTLELWVYMASGPPAANSSFLHSTASNKGLRYYVSTGGGANWVMGTGAGFSYISDYWQPTAYGGSWQHRVLTYNAATNYATPYCGGAPTQVPQSSAFAPQDGACRLFSADASMNAMKIATVRVYGACLSGDDVLANYNAGVTAASTDSSATFLPHVMTHHFYPPLIGGR